MLSEHVIMLRKLRARLIEERRFLVGRVVESRTLPSQNPLVPDIADIQAWIGAVDAAIADEAKSDAALNGARAEALAEWRDDNGLSKVAGV